MLLDQLLNDLDVIHELDKEDYELIPDPTIEAITEKGALINGNWFAKQHLRCNFEKDIFVINWIARKL